MNARLVVYGLGIWIAGTLALRFFGQHLLHPENWNGTILLFAVSFFLMAWIVRRLCRRFQPSRADWPAGAISVALPTLLLDPFSCAYFPAVFPNMSPDVAGLFGGWIIVSLAGALLGVFYPK